MNKAMQLVVGAGLAVLVAYLVRSLQRLVALYLRAFRMGGLTAKLVGPPCYPVLGSALAIAVPGEQVPNRVLELAGQYGHLTKIWIGPILCVLFAEPDDLQVVFTSPHLADKPDVFYSGVEAGLGKGLVVINGADHKRHRRAITASLHFEILQDFMPSFNSKARLLEQRLDLLASSGDVFDASHLMGWCANIAVCETVLSSEAPEKEVEMIADIMYRGSHALAYRAVRPWYKSNLLFWLLDRAKCNEYAELSDSVTSFADAILEQKMHKFKNSSEPAMKPRRQTFLDQFLASPDASALSMAELREELQTLLIAGSATTMDFMSFFMVCMAMHPEEQRKVQKELDDVFGSEPSRDILSSDLPHFKYMECAFKETLRLFPPVPMFYREATSDVDLQSGQVIPEGCIVAILAMAVHRNPEFFPDPLTFDPDRFSAERSRGRHPFAYIPFSAGVRSCIGQRYSTMFTKTLAASVLRRYDVFLDPEGPQRIADVPLVGGISLSIKGGARIRLRRRQLEGLAG